MGKVTFIEHNGTAHEVELEYGQPLMQIAVDKCVTWGGKQGLRFSPKKTVVVVFTRKTSVQPPEEKIKMYGTDIEYSNTVQYLGVHMDSKLKWRHHFKIKMDNAKALLYKMRNALGITWGLLPYLLRWV